MELLK
jgi:hypothetical protein